MMNKDITLDIELFYLSKFIIFLLEFGPSAKGLDELLVH